ncbi:MAG TPA: acetylxylan esterase [Tepidisphaeraceae bacterium]|nr:acetylxylan esterase [Tepidisphaeraceae bacterium]
MPSIDMPLERMREYHPALYRQPDFDAYWEETITEAIKAPLAVELVPYDLPTRDVDCFAVRFNAFQSGELAGWYLRPKATGPHPALCIYHGYSGRGYRPLDTLNIAAQGICVLTFDTRGQNGHSPDRAVYSDGHHSGWMTKGIRIPKEYYFRNVYADAVRALEVLATFSEVDSKRIAVSGASQGGGMSLVAAALSPRPILAMADIPFLCDFRRAIEIAPAGPYTEIATFLRMHPGLYDQTMRTLSYCDVMNLAPWIKCKTIVCNCLCDDICPPSTTFAAYHQITAAKQIEIYPYHKHDVPYEHQELRFRELIKTLQP